MIFKKDLLIHANFFGIVAKLYTFSCTWVGSVVHQHSEAYTYADLEAYSTASHKFDLMLAKLKVTLTNLN